MQTAKRAVVGLAALTMVVLGSLVWRGVNEPVRAAHSAGQTAGANACAMLSAEDAQKIMGAAMQLKKVSNPSVCMYEEVT